MEDGSLEARSTIVLKGSRSAGGSCVDDGRVEKLFRRWIVFFEGERVRCRHQCDLRLHQVVFGEKNSV